MSNSILKECALVALEVHIPTPGRRATKDDLAKAAPELPPEALSTMGVFRIFDPKTIAPLLNIKREGERAIEKVGVKFGRMGRVIPLATLDGIAAELTEIQTRFASARQEVLASFGEDQEVWVRQFPEWEHVLRKKSGNVLDLGAGMDFRFHVLKVQPATDGGDTDTLVQGLLGQLVVEIQAEAKALLGKSFLGREKVAQKAINPIRAMRQKVDGLVFVSPKAQILLDQLDGVLQRIPDKGFLTEQQTDRVRAELHLLSDRKMLLDHIDKVFEARKQAAAGHLPVQEPDEDAAAPPVVFDDETPEPDTDLVELPEPDTAPVEPADAPTVPAAPSPARPRMTIF